MASEDCRQFYRRQGEAARPFTDAASAGVDVATVGWKPVRAETVYRLRLRQPRFPSGKSPAVMASDPVRQQANLKR
ncbi:hypothetical protein DLR11_15335 [Salmonella enterica subsp. salamae]|uniref:Uncharacterized protein n=1 Tax=Salmonella enterica subsp. salamae TaxID=59202 RepID=A0A5Y3V2E9_SALER|nr:hypothetical protein [Salmonella enterica subsp. salamae]ECJ2879084.1 hypothetical protein [Salmonella enterica subsp. enterica serovar Pomona]ECM4294529.1 hypothetical protein [Salmonella enterica subsp. enterica serovar Montevideo]ECG8516883.1 hypothetical protein [Salmonella enterica subsp. salamae]ECI3453172.1 hypothetical protein [Salmonella enterica subsp. salamae]